jgi:hypothetical protein
MVCDEIARCKVIRGSAFLFLLTLLSGAISPALAKAQSHHQVAVAPSRSSGSLGPLPTIVQTLNNCGPASIGEVLSYWGIARTQQQVQAVVRADGSPYGMAPFGVPGYARSLGMRAMIGVDGTERVIKALISNHFPVIANQWVSIDDHIRHYRPIEAYDDRRGIFVSADPYLGPDHVITYGDFAQMWTVSDDRFLVIYPISLQSLLDAVLASAGWSHTAAYRHDLSWEQNRLRHPVADVPATLAHYYGYPSLAWDEMELGNYTAARQALHRAALHGASPVVIGWVNQEIAWRASGHTA